MTTAKTMPRPAPTEAPTAAAVIEFVLASESRRAFIALARSRANSIKSLSLDSSFRGRKK